MKVLHAIHHYWPCIGGMENAVTVLCEEQARQGLGVAAVCLDRCAKSAETLSHCEKRNSVEIARLPFLDLGIYKIAFGALKQSKGCDLIHVHGLGFLSDFFLLTKFIHKKPVVVGSYGGVFHTGSNPLKWLYFNVWNRLLLKAADKVVAISGHDLELFKKIVPEKKIALVPVPVEIGRFKPGKKEKNSFLFIGRLSKNKRVDLLLEAFAASGLKNWELLIAGNDFEGLRNGLEEKAKNLGIGKNVKFLGQKTDRELAGLLAKSEFFVSASDYESFGISAVEAMASGCIPVLSRIASFEGFLQGGKNGFILDFHDCGGAGKKIAGIASLPAAEKAEKRKNSLSYAKNFLPAKIAGRLSAIYLGVPE